jgi:SOS-response transcriptional repressor LexA
MRELEREIDAERLAEEVGHEIAADPRSPLWEDLRFIEWVARDARARDAIQRRWPDSDVLAAGEAMLARSREQRLAVRSVKGRPSVREPSSMGRPVEMIDRAALEHATPVVDLAIAAGVGRELWDEPVDHWIDLPDDLEPGRFIALKISGDSMAPLVHTGDTVLVRIGPAVVGDTVIVARHPEDGYVCKMVGRVRAMTIELASLDPSRPTIVIPRDDSLIVGTVVLVWCHHRGAAA